MGGINNGTKGIFDVPQKGMLDAPDKGIQDVPIKGLLEDRRKGSLSDAPVSGKKPRKSRKALKPKPPTK